MAARKKKTRSTKRRRASKATARTVSRIRAAGDEASAAAPAPVRPQRVTTDQLFDLADAVRDVAVAIGDFQRRNRQLPRARRIELFALGSRLLTVSQAIITDAVGLVLDEAKVSVAALEEVTNEAEKAIERLNDIRKAIGIATAVIGLGAAIVSKDPGAIAKAGKALVEAIRS